jgi:hypothetical protein
MYRQLVLITLAFAVGFIANAQTADTRISQIQIIGSHNSYKQAIDPRLFKLLQERDSASMSKIDYSHISIVDQLNLGLLNLEIDVYADTQGGRYAHPHGLDWVPGQPEYDPQGVMKKPGFKVMHIQDIDFRSHCLTFKQCLEQLKQWSDEHPAHNPVFITMNAKDETSSRPGFTTPEKFTAAVYDALDKEIIDYLGAQYIITPDKVRGKNKTLESAVLKNNWPRLREAQGKFVFILDENGEKRDLYIAGHPSLKDRMLFTNSEPGTPEAAIRIVNNAKQNLANIQDLVKKGYIVRTRADSDTQEARANDRTSFEAALQSGAQIITTDYYQKSTHFNSDYEISFDGGTYFRLNPFLIMQPAKTGSK